MMIIHLSIATYLLLSIIQITVSDVHVCMESSKEVVETFANEDSDLSPSMPSKGLTGYLTTTNPSHACNRIDSPPNIPTFGYHWIALIPRTKSDDDPCDFATKITNAYRANFSAVIIYNYEDNRIAMGPVGQDVGIPSTFVSYPSGCSLLQKYLYNAAKGNETPMYYIQLLPDTPFQFGVYVIPFIAILIFILLSLIGFMFLKCYLQRRRTRRHRLPRSSLKQLRTKKFVKTDPWEVCVICLDDYAVGAKLRILPCQHAYHMKCIDPWLLNNRRQCPVCKRYVFPNLDNPDENDDRHHQPTRPTAEQTPLISPQDNNSRSVASRNRQLSEHQLQNSSINDTPNILFALVESSDDEKDFSSSSGPATTAELVFERSSANSARYGSIQHSSAASRNVNFLIGSIGGTAENTNTSRRLIIEDSIDFGTTDGNDERMHSTAFVSEENPAYVNDEQLTDANQTHL